MYGADNTGKHRAGAVEQANCRQCLAIIHGVAPAVDDRLYFPAVAVLRPGNGKLAPDLAPGGLVKANDRGLAHVEGIYSGQICSSTLTAIGSGRCLLSRNGGECVAGFQ